MRPPAGDADLWSGLAHSGRPFLERLVVYRPVAAPLAIEVFPYAGFEPERMIRANNWLLRAVLAGGIELEPGR